ncbi:hypothetical protein B0H63DRAFT_301073 [Podospora didyma]|uniref:Uncharacterized protein n=1 Tax=Podospora didyma TaxID=330526 RepID=A0AAE0K9I0_9PEZI|nr:hypothetical protein B0H63DRAFT_301073 [Podospora didyma]
MPTLNADVMLLVAEQCDDLETVSALMRTCSTLKRLIASYETSIVKRKLANRGYPSLLPPYGTILSSASSERELLLPYSLAVIQELDMRSRRIEALFGPGEALFNAIAEFPSFTGLDTNMFSKLILGLKRGCMLADRLGDCAVDVMLKGQSRKTNNFTPTSLGAPLSRPRRSAAMDSTGEEEGDTLGSAHKTTGQSSEYITGTMTTNHHSLVRETHLKQLAFIRSLSLSDVGWLSNVAALAGVAYAQVQPALESDPAAWERIVAFKEVFLRQGTATLWAWFRDRGLSGTATSLPASLASLYPSPTPGRPRTDLGRFIERSIANVMADIEAWESGFGIYDAEDDEVDSSAETGPGEDPSLVLPGLHMTLMRRFALKSKDRDRVSVEILGLLIRVLGVLGNAEDV